MSSTGRTIVSRAEYEPGVDACLGVCHAKQSGYNVSYVGHGSGDYVEETVYTFVGRGAGSFQVMPVAQTGPGCGALAPICTGLTCLVLTTSCLGLLVGSGVSSRETLHVVSVPCCGMHNATETSTTPAETSAWPYPALATLTTTFSLALETATMTATLPPTTALIPPATATIPPATATSPPLPTAPLSPRGKSCKIFGDPHIVTFDGQSATYYTPGEYWIVRSENVLIQGRYLPTPMTHGLAVTKQIAISGPFIRNHLILIGSLDMGRSFATYDGVPILPSFPSDFESADGLVAARYNDAGTAMQESRVSRPLRVVHLSLPMGVGVEVNEWDEAGEGAYENVRVTMPAQPGMDGHCGNFNGIAADDDRLAVRERMGRDGVAEGDLLLPGPKTPISPGKRPDISDCPEKKLDSAKELCIQAERRWNPSMACLVDVCFGGAGFAQEDIE